MAESSSSSSVHSPKGRTGEFDQTGNVSSSSMNGKVASDHKRDFLRSQPLSHDDRFLSPHNAAHFDVDKFLVSRATGSTLNEIAAELQMFGGRLRHELDEVVDRDFRGFVNLGVALKAERPRIARLDWRGEDRRQAEGGEVYSSDRVSTREKGSEANLGLDRVRNELVQIRDGLRHDERNVRASMSERQQIEQAQANMQILISFNESLCRLENMLLRDGLQVYAEDADAIDSASVDEHQREFWDAFDVADCDDDLDDEDFTFGSSPIDTDSPPDINRCNGADKSDTVNSKRRATGHVERNGRRRSSLALLSANLAAQTNATGPSLTLPERIQRASSEYSALKFLQEQARSIGFEDYLEAHSERLGSVQSALKQDLASLVRALTRYGGASLLVPGPRDSTADHEELAAWSKIDAGDSERRAAEQRSWIRLALSTWTSLTPAAADEISEAEEEIRSSLVEPWCDVHISPSALQNGEGHAVDDATSSTESLTLSTSLAFVDGHQNEKGTALVRFYNNILNFVQQQTGEVCAIAEDVSTTRTRAEAKDAVCDIFVHSVWREIATRLMECIGGQLFFVGRPDDFRISYTISMAFLDAFVRLAPSQRATYALQQDAVYATFKKRWQLPVYFQMRFRDVVTTFESTVQSTAVELNVEVLSPITTAALNAFVSPWTARSHIAELGHRQWRLSLQMVSRYRTWIQTVLPTEILPAHRKLTDTARNQASEQQQRFGSASQSALNSPVRSGTPTGNDIDHENHLMDVCTSISTDVLHFQSECLRTFEELVSTALQRSLTEEQRAGFDPVQSTMREALRSSLDSLVTQVVPLCASKVTTILKSRSAEPLRLVRSVSTQYRTSSSSNGSQASASYEPSFFVVQFLRPLRQYLGASAPEKSAQRGLTGVVDTPPTTTTKAAKASVRLPKRTREEWIGEVIEDFVVRYTASLTTMSKNFESLQRLKRVNSVAPPTDGKVHSTTTTPSAISTSSESDRMYAQMMADVHYFERCVHELGKETNTDIATETVAWRRLKAASRGEQIDE